MVKHRPLLPPNQPHNRTRKVGGRGREIGSKSLIRGKDCVIDILRYFMISHLVYKILFKASVAKCDSTKPL